VIDNNDNHVSPGVGASAAPRLGAAADAEKMRKRYVFVEEDVVHMAFITEVVKAVV
jgi:hypothetical protein